MTQPDTNSIEEIMQESEGALDRIVMEVLREVYARLPYGQEFELSDGSKAYLKKFYEPRNLEDRRPEFGLDVQIIGGKLDHIELHVEQSGWGRALVEPVRDDCK